MSSWGALVIYAVTLAILCVIARRRSAAVSLGAPAALVVGAVAALVIALSALRGIPVSYGAAIAFACLVVSSASDVATGLIFDAVTVSAAVGIVVWCVITQCVPAALLGAAVSATPLLVLHVTTRGHGIGLGDVKLGGIIGAGVGGVAAIGAIGAAFVAGAICCAPLLLMRRVRRGDRIAFAPFMAVGTIAVIVGRLVPIHG